MPATNTTTQMPADQAARAGAAVDVAAGHRAAGRVGVLGHRRRGLGAADGAGAPEGATALERVPAEVGPGARAPGPVVDLLDVPVLVLELDRLRVLVHGQDLEDLLVVEAFVPLSGHWIVIAAH